ncbi:class I SAM-dependent methyltransferase [Georgenia wutianyii]|nr:methyltransferase [Georgenia wutianyii]
MSEHYFSAQPASSGETRTMTVELRGRRVQVTTAAGVFSGDRLDLGTRVLLEAAPDPAPSGTLVDLGCGWGPVTLALAAASPAARVVAVDVNERARDLTARNAAALGLRNVVVATPEEAADLLPDGITELWSNPPIRIGKPALHELLRTWLGRLAPEGRAYLVVGKNLGADSLHRWIETELALPTERLSSSKGFRVLDVHSPAAAPGADR